MSITAYGQADLSRKYVHLTEDGDRERAFAAAARRLKPGGRFILDMAWFPPEKRERAESPEGLVMEHSGKKDLHVRQTWRIDPETRIGTARFEYSRGGKKVGGSDFPARLWSMEELESRAAEAGLEIAALWGDFDRRPWTRESSERLIAEMRKP